MYRKILVPLENSAYDGAILGHVRELARWSGASVVLIHVADGFAARHAGPLQLRESEEMRHDRAYPRPAPTAPAIAPRPESPAPYAA